MGEPIRRTRALGPLALAVAVVAGSAGISPFASAAEDDPLALYRWLDPRGVVRYTPDLDRVPDSRRKTAIKVIPGSKPLSAPLAGGGPTNQIPAPQPLSGATAGASPGTTPGAPPGGATPSDPDADPFNAPSEIQTVRTEPVDPDEPKAVTATSWPELDARIAELESLIAADEEIIKELISGPSTGDDDELIHSATLREIAARLPVLQGELVELKSWRDDPDGRR